MSAIHSPLTPPGPTLAPDVSVLVPAKDEAENLPLFMELAAAAFASIPSASIAAWSRRSAIFTARTLNASDEVGGAGVRLHSHRSSNSVPR